MENRFLQREYKCIGCQNFCFLKKCRKTNEYLSWRCLNIGCKYHKNYFSIRKNSFFEDFRMNFVFIFQVLIRYSCGSSISISNYYFDIKSKTIFKIIDKLVGLKTKADFSGDKLGGFNNIVQIDETMLNYSCKNHRGRSTSNKTDALCIVEVKGKITRVFACCIQNKKQETLIPIICSQVAHGSTIWTDEHKSYQNLSNFNYIHHTVCHKYEFVHSESGVNTQAVESFNNILKLEIKGRKE